MFVRHVKLFRITKIKLRNKDTKKYLLSVAVCTFVAYVIPIISLSGGIYDGIIRTICICLLNVSTALLAWKFVKSDSKLSLLMWHLGLNRLVSSRLHFHPRKSMAKVFEK